MAGGEDLHIPFLDFGEGVVVAEVAHDLVVIDAVDRHIEVEPVADGGEEVSGGDVLRLAGSGVDGRDVGGGADLAAGDHLMAEGHSSCLGQHHIVVLLVEFLQDIVDAGGVEVPMAGPARVSMFCSLMVSQSFAPGRRSSQT